MKICPVLLISFFSCASPVLAFVQPGDPPLPDFDKRARAASGQEIVSREQRRAVEQLQGRQPHAQVEFDPITGAPRFVWVGSRFLTASNGLGGAIPAATVLKFGVNDPDRATKAFLQEYKDLFRHGPEVLDRARMKQQFVTAHNGLRTVIWQQEVAGIPVFEAIMISHTSRRGELVNISDQFLPDAAGAVERGGQTLTNLGASLKISARRAVAIAAGQIGERLSEEQVEPTDGVSIPGASIAGLANRQAFMASVLPGEAEARLVWLPMNPAQLRLCWEVILTGRKHAEMYRLLLDVGTGEPLVQRCLTQYISDATYRVYTSDSPSPFSPGYSSPTTNQPALVPRTLLTISAFDTNASPNGWIDDGVNETLGNNVDAHTDLKGNDQPDLPRPQGSPFRVFDFALDLGHDPSTYREAAVVQLFYWCNWMHDQLYDLGFTEEAGNFQSNNFGRGGLGNDALQAQAQDGGGFNNANFSAPPDGSPPRMRMYIWNSPTPARDCDLDAEIILHEYTHGLSNRRVGGGQGLYELQSAGMGEGWSDFYALSLLSQSGDDVDGVYAVSAYSIYALGRLEQNYYFGIRRYPYCTDLRKNPLTFKDIDPTQADSHSAIPRSPLIGTFAAEVHNMGEVWCVTLWDARANLIRKYGGTVGNRLVLQIVTDGMALSPPNPNYLQARDAILQAELLDSGGTNQVELWNAFAKRGMGRDATSPLSFDPIGVHESFDVPDDMRVTPGSAASFLSVCGQPGVQSCQAYLLSNTSSNVVNWTAWATEPWVSVQPTSGSIAPGISGSVAVCLTPDANTLPAGDSAAAIVFSNTVTTATDTRPVLYRLTQPALCFPLDTQPAWTFDGEWAFGKPAGLGGMQYGNPDPTSAATGMNVFGINLNGDYSVAVSGPHYLTAGPFDFSGYTGMILQFQRWLNTDFQPYVYATIEASSDGTNWIPVWDNGTTEIADQAWTPVSYDISALADNQTNVFVRWGHYVSSPLAFPYSGWNIDDIEFIGNPMQQLAVTIPPAANAGVGTLTGAVAASPAPVADLTVTLTSSDASAVAVPAFVILPAGQSNVIFDLTIADELKARGSETVLIRASAPDYVASSAGVEVSDSAAVTLHLSLPPTAVEGDGTIEGAVYIRDVQTNALLVQLSSSNTTVLQVPDSIFIPVGQTTAVFGVTVVEDNRIDGPQVATVTAHVPGWIDATANVVVQENKGNLAVTVPASVWENSGPLPNAGLVSISGILPTNLTVFLASSAPERLSVPSFVMIPSGQVSETFDLSPMDNSIPDGPQMVTIETSAPGFTDGTAVVSVLDDETPPAPSNPLPADLATNIAQTTGLAWQQGFVPGRTITNDIYFGVNPTPGPAEFVGSTTNQNWTVPLLAPQTTYYWQILARETGVTQGPVWQFTTRGVDHFSWDTIPSPQNVNQSFPVVITARDAFDSVVSNFTGVASLHSLTAVFTPTNSGPFAAGVWQGAVTVSKPAANVSLIADDGAGHTGASDLFDVVLTNDISITITADPDPVPAGMPLTYTMAVANFGTEDATGVVVTNILPPNVSLVSITPSQGDWQETNGVVTASLGSVPGSSNATLTVVVVPSTVGDTLTNVAWVFRAEVESYLDNNSAVIETKVGPPAVSIADAVITEGTTGTTDMLFAVTLSAASPKTVSVNYSTADGSGLAGRDYLATNGALVLPPGTTNASVSVPVIGDVVAESNTFFFVNLSGPSNAVPGRSQAVGTIIEVPPGNIPATIVLQPTNQIAEVGGTVTFLVIAGGTPPLSYQWSSNGTNMVDATNSALVLTNVQLADGGSYAVEVSNAFGSQPSSNAVLSVGEPPAIVVQPMNQVVGLGGAAAFEVTVVGTPPIQYQWSLEGVDVVAATNNLLAIASVQLSDGGQYAVKVSNVFGVTNSSDALLTVGVPPTIVLQPTNQAVAVGAEASLSVVAEGTEPLSYQWSSNGTNMLDATNSALVLTNVQLADGGSYAVEVSNAFGSQPSSNAVLSVGEPPAIVVQPMNQVVGLGGAAAFEVTVVGTPPIQYQWSLEGVDVVAATNNLLAIASVQLSDGGQYAVKVSNVFGVTNSSDALLTVGVPPTIVLQPTNQAVAVGAEASLSVVAEGTEPLSYQWSSNGTNMLDATNSALVLTNVQLADGGSYAVEVSNAFGSQPSSNAVLSVGEPPAIVVQPMNQVVGLGGAAAFEVTVVGTPPIQYQWSLEGVDVVDGGRITGANSSDLNISNVVPSDGGSYAIAVTNSWGFTLSSNATLFVYVIDHFAWDPIPSPRFIGVPFRVRIQAVDSTNGLISVFANSVHLESSSGIPIHPSVSGAFAVGTWTGSVTISQAVAGAVLVADDGHGHLGYANPVNVVGLPSLSVAQTGASLLLSWPVEASMFAPETSANMSSWSPLTNRIVLAGDTYQTRVAISATRSFYRLRFIGP